MLSAHIASTVWRRDSQLVHVLMSIFLAHACSCGVQAQTASANPAASVHEGGALGGGRIVPSAAVAHQPALVRPPKLMQLAGRSGCRKAKGGRGRPGVRICDEGECRLVAKFGDPAGGGPVKCRAHKLPSHRILRGWTPCLHAEGCSQKSSFGFRSGRPIFCQAHKSSAHVSLSFRGRKCLFDGCAKQPSFGSPADGRIRFCQRHKGASDVFLRSVRCRHPEGCLKAASFASPGGKVPAVCLLHRRSEHVRIVGVKNDTSLAETSVCPRCLQRISRRNMAKHRVSTQCRARSATPYIKQKRCRMGRDVTDALKGRRGRRHPTLCETPALHAENFMDNVIDSGDASACPSESRPADLLGASNRSGRAESDVRQLRRVVMPTVLNGVASRALAVVRSNSAERDSRIGPDLVVNADEVVCADETISPNLSSLDQRFPRAGSGGGLQLRRAVVRCHKCVSNKRSAAYCCARMHPRPRLSLCKRSQVLSEEKRSVYLGVGWCAQKNKWRARFGRIHLGFFEDEHEAAQARERHRMMSAGNTTTSTANKIAREKPHCPTRSQLEFSGVHGRRERAMSTSSFLLGTAGERGQCQDQTLNNTWQQISVSGYQNGRPVMWKCVHGRQKSLCVPCGGAGICEHRRRRRLCRTCTPSSFCAHGKLTSRCMRCPGGGSALCAHGRQKGTCRDCGVRKSVCPHNKQKSRCFFCGGAGLCVHKRRLSNCRECKSSSLQTNTLVGGNEIRT